MASGSGAVLPSEILSQIIYQYVLGIWFKDVLRLRLVSKFFDLEVIRALLDTVEYRPPVNVNWRPLTYHLFHASVIVADGTGNNICHSIKTTLKWFDANMPAAIHGNNALNKLCEMHTLDVAPDLVNQALHKHTAKSQNSNELQGPLLAAIACDELPVVQKLLEMGANVDTKISWRTAMDVAAQTGSTAIMRLLLSHSKANIFNRDNSNNIIGMPLTLASGYGHVEATRLLITSPIYYNGSCPKEILGLLKNAAKKGHLEVLKYLSQEFHSYYRRPESSFRPTLSFMRRTVFHIAAREGHRQIVEAMLRNEGFFSVNVGYAFSYWKPFKEACRGGHVDIARLLHERCPGLYRRNEKRHMQSAMEDAAAAGHIEICKYLLANDTAIRPRAFEMAALNGQVSMLQWLHDHAQSPSSFEIRASVAAHIIRTGFVPVIQYIYSQLTVRPDPTESQDMDDFDDNHNEHTIFPKDPVLTAMVNGQDRMINALRHIGLPQQDAAAGPCAKEFDAGTYPLYNGPYCCVKVIEDFASGHNIQMWARKVVGDFVDRKRWTTLA